MLPRISRNRKRQSEVQQRLELEGHNMKPLWIDWHLGLGDAIIRNGLVRWLARENPDKTLMLPCWMGVNEASVRHMFSDLKNVQVNAPPLYGLEELLIIGMGGSAHKDGNLIYNPRWGEVQPFDRAFYEFAGVPFDAKWNLFHVPEDGRGTGCGGVPVILFHEDPERGFLIDRSRLTEGVRCPVIPVHIDRRPPRITDWKRMIREAAEIHCIDSAVMHLAELLPTTGKLFYHKYARPAAERHSDAVFRKPWTVLE
jgi:hypothetical protein